MEEVSHLLEELRSQFYVVVTRYVIAKNSSLIGPIENPSTLYLTFCQSRFSIFHLIFGI